VLTTLHGRQDLRDLPPLYRAFPELKLVAISEAQRRLVPEGNFAATIHHGLPVDLYRPTLRSTGNYLAFLGRISPEKNADVAIEIARRAGMTLKLAAKVDPVDQDYFGQKIQPLLRQPGIDHIGEIDDPLKERFLGDAAALVLPITWPEPFGLVMIEAMACGTPVLAFPAGSVPEVVDHGVTGMIVNTVDEAVAALPALLQLDRRRIRRCFEERFTSRRMARDYVAVYEHQLGLTDAGRGVKPPAPHLLARQTRVPLHNRDVPVVGRVDRNLEDQWR
jgi:glycosyltransferase involved in cell wall biosynthesis